MWCGDIHWITHPPWWSSGRRGAAGVPTIASTKTVALIPLDATAAAADIHSARRALDAHGVASIVIHPSLAPARNADEPVAADWLVTDDAAWIAAGADSTKTIVIHEGTLHSDHDPDFTAVSFAAGVQRILRAEGLDGAPRWVAVGAAHLAALPHALDMPEHRAIIEVIARGIAERTGVDVLDLEVDAAGVTVRVHGSDFIALGLLTELRRSSAEWAASRGVGPFWRE